MALDDIVSVEGIKGVVGSNRETDCGRRSKWTQRV